MYSVINPKNLKAIGFDEITDDSKLKYRRTKDLIWFIAANTYEGNLRSGKSFSDIAKEIIEKLG